MTMTVFGCTPHWVMPHAPSPTSTYKGAEGVKKWRGVALLQSSWVYTVWAEPLNLHQAPFLCPCSHKIQ